jgi:hypothetical protein
MKYAFIQSQLDIYAVTRLCEVLDVCRSAYYDWLDRPSESTRAYFVTTPIVPMLSGKVISFAQAAIYSEHFHQVAIIRKVPLRMSSWMNYLFPFH